MNTEVQTKIPMDMLTQVEDGYYAGPQLAAHLPTWFFRVSRPKKGQFKDCLKIQTQHAWRLSMCMVVWPSGRITWYNRQPENELMMVAIDPKGSAIRYGQELGHCCRCNTELTDNRSRYYGIGPDCEEHWPWVIDQVDTTKGQYLEG
jgi:uncharacterized protein DUF6011